jgi:hypothetical protein
MTALVPGTSAYKFWRGGGRSALVAKRALNFWNAGKYPPNGDMRRYVVMLDMYLLNIKMENKLRTLKATDNSKMVQIYDTVSSEATRTTVSKVYRITEALPERSVEDVVEILQAESDLASSED